VKISEFIEIYRSCPMCNKVLDCIMYIRLMHSIPYLLSRKVKSGFDFTKVANVNYGGPNDEEARRMPNLIRVRDKFLPIFDDRVYLPKMKSDYGTISFGLECKCNDFSIYSTSFSMFDEVQEIYTDYDKFTSDDITVINYYLISKTIMIDGMNTYEKSLIAIDKWPLHDKLELKDKIDKIIVLL